MGDQTLPPSRDSEVFRIIEHHAHHMLENQTVYRVQISTSLTPKCHPRWNLEIMYDVPAHDDPQAVTSVNALNEGIAKEAGMAIIPIFLSTLFWITKEVVIMGWEDRSGSRVPMRLHHGHPSSAVTTYRYLEVCAMAIVTRPMVHRAGISCGMQADRSITWGLKACHWPMMPGSAEVRDLRQHMRMTHDIMALSRDMTLAHQSWDDEDRVSTVFWADQAGE